MLNYFRDQMIAAKHSSSWIEKHQVGRSVFECKRCERLQRQGEPRFAQNCLRAAPLELQPQIAVAPTLSDAFRIRFAIQTGVSGGSIR